MVALLRHSRRLGSGLGSAGIGTRIGSGGEARGLVLLGFAAFLVFCLVFAPARLAAPVVERIPGASLNGVQGTIWAGAGRLLLHGRDVGRFAWGVRPTSLLTLFPGIDWTLSGDSLELHGALNLTASRLALSMSGSIDSAAVNPWLGIYELSLSGEFNVRDLSLQVRDGRPEDAGGTLDWSGGRLRYVLSQRAKSAQLPPLQANLEFTGGILATVVEKGQTTALLKAELLDNGFARIGVTMLLTRLLNEPWPGGGSDDKVVLSVEEQIMPAN